MENIEKDNTKKKSFTWLKFRNNFITGERALLKLKTLYSDKGKVYTYIYIEMLIATLNSDGIFRFEQVGDSIEEELAMVLNENLDDIKATVDYLEKYGLVVRTSDYLELVKFKYMVGKETEDAERKRNERAAKKAKNTANSNNIAIENASISKQAEDTSGQAEDTSGQAEDTSGQAEDTSGQTEDTSGQAEDTSGQAEDTSGQAEDTSGQTEGTSGQAEDTSGHCPIEKEIEKEIDLYKADDDTSGKIPAVNDKYNLVPKTDEDYQALVDEMLSVDPFERPDLVTSVDEEKGLIDEMFNSYDAQKVIRAMKKAKDNRAKSFTYARQILQKQRDSSTKPLKVSNQELVIPFACWDEMLSVVTSEARKDILEETPEEFREKVLGESKFYSAEEITDALRKARLEFEASFEGDEKVYSYFQFILKFENSLQKEAVANNVDPQSYILKKFNLLWEKQQE